MLRQFNWHVVWVATKNVDDSVLLLDKVLFLSIEQDSVDLIDEFDKGM